MGQVYHQQLLSARHMHQSQILSLLLLHHQQIKSFASIAGCLIPKLQGSVYDVENHLNNKCIKKQVRCDSKKYNTGKAKTYMKCIKCNQDTPDNSRFCMVCGAEQVKVNVCPSCKQEVPAGALFCPFCGQMVINSNLRVSTAPTKSAYDQLTDYRQLISVGGILLGQSNVTDAQRKGYVVTQDDNNCNVFKIDGVKFGQYRFKNVVSYMCCDYTYGDYYHFPHDWEQKYGISASMSYKEWTEVLTKMGLKIRVVQPTQLKDCDGRLTFYGVIEAMSEDKKFKAFLAFARGNRNGEGYEDTSKGSLIFFRFTLQ